jgi:hypothetical protein
VRRSKENNTTKERKPNRGADPIVADLEARIASVEVRDARRVLNADPGRGRARVGLAAFGRPVSLTQGAALLEALEEVVPQVERCMGLHSEEPAAKRRGRVGASSRPPAVV